jgi:hypothetical protein
MAADTPAADAPETAAADSGADLPSEELLRERWGAFVSDYASERLSGNPGQSSRLVNALAPAPLSFSKGEDDRLCVSFEVVNEAQRRWIESNLREMERHYNRFFSSSRLHLAVSVRPETPEDSNRVYLPEEKARDLMERNPELRTFVKDLGLDTK